MSLGAEMTEAEKETEKTIPWQGGGDEAAPDRERERERESAAADQSLESSSHELLRGQEVLGGALGMVVQALAHMQEAMQTMTNKMNRTDDTVRSVQQALLRLEAKIETIESNLTAALSSCRQTHERVEDVDTRVRTHTHSRSKHSRTYAHKSRAASNNPFLAYNECVPGLTDAERMAPTDSAVAAPSVQTGCALVGRCMDDSAVAIAGSVTREEEMKTEGLQTEGDEPLSQLALLSRGSSGTDVLLSTYARHAALGRRLLQATQAGRIAEVHKVLKEGADARFCNGARCTALHMAASQGHADAVSLLLEYGAEANATNAYGFTPLHMAARNDASGRCVAQLLYAGADVDSANRFGRTPLHYAAARDNQAAVLALLAAGARTTLLNDEGRTPYDVAKTDRMRRLLKQHVPTNHLRLAKDSHGSPFASFPQ